MSYESPIEIFEETVSSQYNKTLEEAVMQEVTRIGVYVDKQELIKALQHDRDQYNRGYHDGLNANKWISTEDRMPICGVPVIVTYDSGYVATATLYCLSDGRYVWENARGHQHHTDAIIAWQPLPEPYKEDE